MSSLEEDLRELADLVPKLPHEATALTEAARTLVATVGPLLQEVRVAGGAAGDAALAASSLGQAFAKHVGELEDHLQNVLAEATEEWEEARQAVATAADAALAAGTSLARADRELSTTLSAATADVDPTEEAEAATERLRETAIESSMDLDSEGRELIVALSNFEDLMGDRVPRINAASEALMRHVEGVHQRIAETARTLTASLSAKAAALEEGLGGVLTALAADLEQQRSESTEQLLDAVGRPLEEAGDAAALALAALGDGLTASMPALLAARDELAQAIAEVNTTTRSIPDRIRQINEAHERIDGL
jgi:hypothetical protein